MRRLILLSLILTAHRSPELALKELLKKETVTYRDVERLSPLCHNQRERVDQLYETIALDGDFKRLNILLILRVMLLEEQHASHTSRLATGRLPKFHLRSYGLVR